MFEIYFKCYALVFYLRSKCVFHSFFLNVVYTLRCNLLCFIMSRQDMARLGHLKNTSTRVLLPQLFESAIRTATSAIPMHAIFQNVDKAWKWGKRDYKPTLVAKKTN